MISSNYLQLLPKRTTMSAINNWKHKSCPCKTNYGMTHCQMRGTNRGTVRHIVRWKALVVIAYGFTWQCVIRYHNQCISPGNVLCGTTTSVFHLAMYHTLSRPVPFIWQCVLRGTVRHSARLHWSWYRMTLSPVKGTGRGTIWRIVNWNTSVVAMCYTEPQPVLFIWQRVMLYHNQCISADNVSYGTTTSTFHRRKCHAVPRPVQPSNMSNTLPAEIHWLWYRMTHLQVKGTGCGTHNTLPIRYHDQCYMTMRHTVTQPMYFTWQYVIRYHDQCLSPCNVSYGTTTCAFHMAQRLIFRLQVLTGCSFSVTWESSVIFCGYGF
jgi:hypothetical protein